MSDVLKRLLCLVLALVVVFSFSACRHSPVLEQKVYTQDAETDPEQQQMDNQEDHTQEDTTLPPRTTKQDQSQKADQTKVSAKNPRQNPQTRTNTNTNGQNTNSPSPKPANDTQNNTNKGTGEVPGVNVDPNSPVPAVDPNSQNKPEPTDEVGTVAAVGEAALYVEMLGGPNRLVATSASFTENPMASLFPDYTNLQGKDLWEKTGEEALAEDAFNALLGIHPEAVFFISETEAGNSQGRLESFTPDQIGRLQAAGIKTVPLSRFNTTHNIQNNVRIIGETLGKGSKVPGSKNAKEMADRYISWMNGIIKNKESQTFSGTHKWNLDMEGDFLSQGQADDRYSDAGDYTILINGWATDAVSDFDPSGSAYAISGYSQRSSPASYFLSIGGLANTAVLQAGDLRTRFIPVIPMYQAVVSGKVNGDSLLDYGTYLRQNDNMTNPETGVYIGTDRFRTIIVDSNNTRDMIYQSESWQPRERVRNPESGIEEYGRLNGDGIDYSNVHGPYNVVVNPRGIGSWTTGSPESPLEVLWAEQLVMLSDETNENTLQDLAFQGIQDRILEFYSEFYGIDNPDLNAIKNGA